MAMRWPYFMPIILLEKRSFVPAVGPPTHFRCNVRERTEEKEDCWDDAKAVHHGEPYSEQQRSIPDRSTTLMPAMLCMRAFELGTAGHQGLPFCLTD